MLDATGIAAIMEAVPRGFARIDMESRRPHSRAPLDAQALLERALKLLGNRDYAEKELRERITALAAEESEVEAVLTRLRELGFLDESRFAVRLASDAAARRLVGKRRVTQELKHREVDDATIARAVESAYEGRDESALALEHLETRLSAILKGQGLEEKRALQRAYGRLRRAGFGHASTIHALRAHSSLATEIDEFAPDDEE